MYSKLSTAVREPIKVYFDNVNFSSNSGPNSFAGRLADYLVTKNRIRVVSAYDEYDTFLCFIEPTVQPRAGANFLHRLDGIWFKPEQFHTHNTRIKWAYDNCDGVIWQSNFDKAMTVKWWGDRSGDVIHNGIDHKIPKIRQHILDIRKKYNRVFVCAANWHRQKRLKENVELFQALASPSDCLVVMGANPDFSTSDERILYTGNIPHEACLELYTIADWFIHLAWLDHCPNVVVEALSCNCPVICTDSGGTKEIVRSNGYVIKETKPYKFGLVDYDDPPPLNLQSFSLPDIEVKADYLSMETVAEKYYEQFCMEQKRA